ncbi:MAG: SPOR domain-containing protein [Bacteroidales bacterium]
MKEVQPDSVGKVEGGNISEGEIRKTYYIIVGSFVNPNNAKLVAEKYRSLGYQTSIVRTANRIGNNVELVSVKTFNNYDDAVLFQIDLIGKVGSKSWIYSN